jgi:predicted nuclease with TOPRIM domain
MSRFEALGHFVYEKGERIGVTPPEAAVELARKLNAYQMRVERFKAEVERLKLENSQYEEHHKYGQNVITSLREQVERLTKAGDMTAGRLERFCKDWGFSDEETKDQTEEWRAAKEGKQP